MLETQPKDQSSKKSTDSSLDVPTGELTTENSHQPLFNKHDSLVDNPAIITQKG